jgi:hypothetical protein
MSIDSILTKESNDNGTCKNRELDRTGILEVSNFLNQFQSHFLAPSTNNNKNDDESESDEQQHLLQKPTPLGNISPKDLETVLEFRTLLEKFRILEEELHVIVQYGNNDERIAPITLRLVKNKKEELDNLHEEVESVGTDRMKLLLKLLQRFEVWTCKFVAQDQLVTSTRLLPADSATKGKIKQESCCFSPFINIPSSKYFEELVPSIDIDDGSGEDDNEENEKMTPTAAGVEAVAVAVAVAETNNGNSTGTTTTSSTSTSTSTSAFFRRNKCIQCCTLAMPPNKHTWEAYARLAIMASFLNDDSDNDFPTKDDDGERDDSNEITTCNSTTTNDDKREKSLIKSLNSPACIYDCNRYKKGQNPSQKQDYNFTSSDLIPLWIRAQRNTQALRQLFLLFEVQVQTTTTANNNEDNDIDRRSIDSNNVVDDSRTTVAVALLGTGVRGGGKRLVVNITDNEDGDDSQQQQQQQQQQQEETITHTSTTVDERNNNLNLPLKAILRGNPTSIKLQIAEVSNYVDQLVEWAVVNQSIYTYQRIKKQILTAPLQKQQQKQDTLKRRRQIDPVRFNTTKRIRNESKNDKDNDNLFELRQACQSYLLRWFARRNRNALTILFSNRSERFFLLDIGCMMNNKVLKQAAALKEGDTPSDVKDYMQQLPAGGDFHFEDRTFARIDRRFFIKGRYDGSNTAVPCQSQLFTLLESLSNVCPKNQASHKTLVDAAKEDLNILFSTFSPTTTDDGDDDDDEDAIYETALKLVSSPKDFTEQSLINLLKSSPAPWAEKCCKCEKVGNTELRTCLNCEQVFHEKCSDPGHSTSVSLKNLIQSFPPLNEIFNVKRPENLDPPDFSTLDWVKETITIDRQIEDDGKASKLGISFENTVNCSKLFEILQSDDACYVAEQMNLEDTDSRGRKCKIPARIRHKGYLLTAVKKDYGGDQAGLQKGDIITSVEFSELVHAEDEQIYGESKVFDMSTLTHDSCMTLFQVQSLRLNVTVLRPPSANIIKLAKNWYASMIQLNKNTLDVLRGLNSSSLWYCGACTQSKASDESRTVFLEAEYCRAVIRRIGMEAYAQPFWEGNQKDESGFFCLRRLDSIMTHIMRVQSKDDSYDSSPEAFLTPPQNNSIRMRLGWATKKLEKRPMELFCEAMDTLMHSSFPGVSQLITKRSALVRHFLIAFSSWCVGATVKSSSFRAMVGPPDTFRYSRSPWFGASCSVCCSRPAENENVTTCKNKLCMNQAARSERHIDDIDNKEITRIGNTMSEYSKQASLVGTLFLVLPSDPLVEYISKIVRIDHENRPIEFIVSSYLPPDYHDTVVNGRQKTNYDQFDEGDGIYHLLPVVNARQQLFLLERCKVRNQKENNSRSNFSWASLDVLNLDGVARYSPAALRNKIKYSNRIRLAIDSAIVQELCKSSFDSPNLSSHSRTTNEDRVTMLQYFYTPSTDPNLGMQNKLIDTLLKGKASTKLVRGLLCTDSTGEQSVQVENEIDSSNWKIIQREGDKSHELEFGLSLFHQGLIPVNAIKANTLQILLPSSVLEGKSMLYYSDFLFQDEAGKRNIANTLFPSNLSPYQGSHSKLLERTITLSPSVLNNVFGWGFEIMKWKNERILRVGRVKRGSSAHRMGIKPHDIVIAVNGRKYTKFYEINDLVASIMGAPGVNVRMDKNQSRFDGITMILSTIKNSNIKISPVVLSIYRPSPVDDRANMSQTSISRPQTSAHRPLQQNRRIPPLVINPLTNANSNQGHGVQRTPTIINPLTNANSNQGRVVHRTPTINAQPMVINPLTNTNSNQGRVVHRTPTINAPTHVRNSAPATGRSESTNNKLMGILRDTYNDRPLLQQNDFYRAAGSSQNGIILTVMEVSVFYENYLNGNYKLGMRLLMPRYDLKTVVEQVKRLICWTPEMIVKIPIVKREFHSNILQLDCDRMNDQEAPEIGDFILIEKSNGVDYKYRLPRKPLPIDRTVEMQFQHSLPQQPPIQHHQHRPLPSPPQQYPHTQYGYPNTPHHHMWQSHLNNHHEYNNQHQHPVNYNDPRQADRFPHHSLHANWPHQQPNGHLPPNHAQGTERNNNYEYPQSNGVNQEETAVVNLLDSEGENSEMSAVGELDESTDEPSLAFYNEGTYNRGQHGNRGRSDREPISQSNSYPSERIRGGGEPEESATDQQSTDTCLYDLSPTEWEGKAVFTFVQTASEGSMVNEATLVGFAKGPQEWNSEVDNIPDKVEVKAYYLSSIGYFDAMKINEFFSDDVWVVDTNSDSEEAKVIAKLRSQNTLHVTDDGQEEEEEQQDPKEKTSPVSHATYERLEEEEEQQDPMKKAASALANSFTDLQFLGKSPDGRDVMWISNDPMAIYLEGAPAQRVEQHLQRQYLLSLQKVQEILRETHPDIVPLRSLPSKCYTCVWGCSIIGAGGERQCLTFPSETELYRHYSSYHFCQSDSMVTLCEARKFTRIQDGKRLVEFASAITSAIVARFPLLEKQVKRGDCCKEAASGVEFFTSPTGQTLNFPANQSMFDFCLKVLNSKSAHVKYINDLIQLWIHIAKLFQCDTTGISRLDQNEFHPTALPANYLGNDPLCHEFEKSKQNYSCEKKSVGLKTTCCRGYHNCSLCSLPFERYLVCSTSAEETSSNKDDSKIILRRSIGCGLMSDVALAENNSENDIPGRLGEGKMFLLQVGTLIPESVKLTAETPQRNKFSDPLASFRVFDSDLNYTTWKAFVAECTCTQMLAQALVALLASIQRSKLPDWWSRDNSGWSTSYVIMAESSLSTLYLHMYMLDAALTDILSRTLHATFHQQKKSDEANLIQQRKMSKLWKLAMSYGYEPFEGNNNGECYHCNDGGTLLCCELCPKVQHHECCVPQLSPAVKLDHWMCDSCINDIENYEEEEEEEFEDYQEEDEESS